MRDHNNEKGFCGLSLYVNHKPEKDHKVHKERVNSISDYSLENYIWTDLEQNLKPTLDYFQRCKRESFKFFVNGEYKSSRLLKSLNEVLRFDNRIGDPNKGLS